MNPKNCRCKNCSIPSSKPNSQRKRIQERQKIINHFRRLSTIDEMEVRSQKPSVSSESNFKGLKRSASGILIEFIKFVETSFILENLFND